MYWPAPYFFQRLFKKAIVSKKMMRDYAILTVMVTVGEIYAWHEHISLVKTLGVPFMMPFLI